MAISLVLDLPANLRAARVSFAGADAEHRAGQTAATTALAELLGNAGSGAEIIRADDGAPEVRGLSDPPLVSISHGRRTAVAVVGRVSALGIDLCDLDQATRVSRIAERFLHPDEEALADGGDDALWATLWALKEAGAKALRLGVFDGGLAATRVASLRPARFAWPAFEAVVTCGTDDVVAIAYRDVG